MKAAVAAFKPAVSYRANLKRLKTAAEKTNADLLLFGEVCLTGFDYDHFDEAAAFARTAHETLCEISKTKAVALTLIEKKGKEFFNVFKLYDLGKVIYERPKYKLFRDENDHFAAPSKSPVEIIEWRGWKIAVLVCYEVRFIDLWQQLAGAQMVLVPAHWDAERRLALKALSKAIAIVNKCFVLCANSAPKTKCYLYAPSGERLPAEFQIDQKATLDGI
ncbi:hypothetical protein FACS1894103_6180 [Campylobacterota bacterium]|nr:hypothetical protein FACS1894103_6180 [Campylobacterota bacterium]